jgi:Cytochrome c7 and related cytochrome c
MAGRRCRFMHRRIELSDAFQDRAMPGLFPRWANSGVRWGIAIGVILLASVPIGLMAWVRSPYDTGEFRTPDQPVAFDHRHHVADDGIDCRYCHTAAERSMDAGMPASDLCMNCHAQIWNDSPLLEPVRRSWFEREPIAWARVYRLPDFVFFDHASHLAKGVGCEECHGRVDRMAGVYQAVSLSMSWCLDCHRDPTPHLRPPSEVTVMGWSSDRPRREVGREIARRYDVKPRLDCSACHR